MSVRSTELVTWAVTIGIVSIIVIIFVVALPILAISACATLRHKISRVDFG